MEPKYQQKIQQGNAQQAYQQEKMPRDYSLFPVDGQTCNKVQICTLHFVSSESKLLHPNNNWENPKKWSFSLSTDIIKAQNSLY